MKPYFILAKNGPEKAEKLAYIQGGKHDKEYIWLCHGDTIDNEALTPEELSSLVKLVRSKLEKKGHFTPEQLNEQTNKILQKFEPDEKLLEIDIKDGEIIPYPTLDTRQVVYTAGCSGSGKSYSAKKYAMMYNKCFPKNKIFLFSKVSNDVSLKGIKNLIPIELNHELVEDEITIDELADSLCYFDDTDCIGDKDLLKAVNNLKDSILETGRHANIHCVITSHLISDYKRTRTVLNEAHLLTVFPSSGSSHQIRSVLSKYFGLDKQDIDKLFKLNTRAVTIRKNFPQLVMSAHKVYLIGTVLNGD